MSDFFEKELSDGYVIKWSTSAPFDAGFLRKFRKEKDDSDRLFFMVEYFSTAEDLEHLDKLHVKEVSDLVKDFSEVLKAEGLGDSSAS